MGQSLTNIVSVTVEVSPTGTSPATFNLGLIVGSSTIISTATRTKLYSGTQDMTADGWSTTAPEYLAAEAYFEQDPRPTDVVIGRQGSVSTTLTSALVSGTAYTVLDVAALAEDIASGTTVTIGTGGTTQTVTTSADSPVGSTTINVTSFNANAAYASGTSVSAAETLLEAVTACRSSNGDWYGVYPCGATDADIEAIAAYIESVTPQSYLFYDTQDAAISAGTTPNLFTTVQGDKYQRAIGIYTSTVEYAGAAVMGLAMGLNTGLANSAFTLDWKTLVGINAEKLTTTQYNNIKGWNGNVYTTFGSKYTLFSPGVAADGTPFDQVLNTDILTADIQSAVISAMTSAPKIPQTDAGVTILVDAINTVLSDAATQGILAPGVWNAGPVLGLQKGTSLPAGYIVIADKIANQPTADITARKSPPIYACVIFAGAIQQAIIGLIVDL